MLGAEDGATVVVVEHVGGEGTLEVIPILVLEGLPLFLLLVLSGLGGLRVRIGLRAAGLLFLGGLRLVLGALGSGGSGGGRGRRDCRLG